MVVGFRKTLYFIDRSVVLLVRQPRRVALEDCGLLVEARYQGLPGVTAVAQAGRRALSEDAHSTGAGWQR